MIEHRSGSVRRTVSDLARRVSPRRHRAHEEETFESGGTNDRSRLDSEGEKAHRLDVEATNDGPVREFDVRTLAEDVGLPECEPCDAVVRAIVRRAGAGDVIRFRGGRFLLQDLHVLETSLIVEGDGATLDFDESGGIHFRGSHYNGADPQVTTRAAGSVERGERVIAVEGTDGFGDGDHVLVETGYAGWSSRHPLRAGSGYRCQVTRLERIGADRLVLDRTTETRFDANDTPIEIHRIEPLEFPVFRDLTTVGGRIPLRMESCVGGRFERCEVSRYRDYGQRVDYCLDTVYDGSVVTNPRRRDGQNEAIHVAHSTETTIDRPEVYECRVGIGLSNGCFGVEIADPIIGDASEHAITTPGGSATAGEVRLDGVTVATEADGDGTHPGSALSFSTVLEGATIGSDRPNRRPVSAQRVLGDSADVG